MTKFLSPSLFTRLYLTIAIAVIVSGSSSFFFIEKIHLQNTIDEYVIFTTDIYNVLLKEGKIIPNTPLKDLNEDLHDVEGFLISWQYKFSDGPPCDECEILGQSGKVVVYQNKARQFFSLYKLPNVAAWLVIRENNLFDFDKDEEQAEPVEQTIFSEYSLQDITELILLFTVFITVAFAIYWPVRVIQRQIETLIQVQHQFGAGDMQVRASSNFTKPLDELAASFNTMASSISETVNENQVFAQAVPHEVRTPLSRIQLAVGLLSQNNNNAQQIALLDNIDSYIDDISELISQVVDFSKLNSIKDEDGISLYQEIKLGAFIESRIMVTKCEENRAVIRQVDNALVLTTNPAYLRLLVDNLLKNAAIHSKNKIIISLNAFEGYTELSIEDDGDGIPKEYFDTIFIPFSRIDVSRSRKTGGLGLGLAISKAACNRMNSQLTVENNLTAGAKFTCRFFNNI